MWESIYTGLPDQPSRDATADEKANHEDVRAAVQMSKMQQLFSIHVTICKLIWFTDIDYVMIQHVLQGQLKNLMNDAFFEKKVGKKSPQAAATVFPRFFQSSARAFQKLNVEQRDLLYMTTIYFMTVSISLDNFEIIFP